MKKCFTLFICLLAVVLYSCDDKTKEEIRDVIVLSRSSVAFATEGGSTTIAVASPSEWVATCPDAWVTLNPEKEYLTISVNSNAGDDVRDAKITITSSASQKEVEVHQAFSSESTLLSISAPETILFDSEGEDFTFMVTTNGEWEVTSDVDWLDIDTDQGGNSVKITAAPNTTDHRAGTLTVTSTKSGESKTAQVALTQQSKAENPYYKLLGSYGLHAQDWSIGGSSVGIGGTGTFCTIEQKEYRKSYNIKDLFINGTVIEATFDKETGNIDIRVGGACKQEEISSTVTRLYMLMSINLDTRSFSSGTITARPGTALSDQNNEMRKALLFGTLPSGNSSLGVIGYQSSQYVSFNDVYYATGSMYLVEWDDSKEPTAVTSAAAKMSTTAGSYQLYPFVTK